MDIAYEAFRAQKGKETEKAIKLFFQAYELERQAAIALIEISDNEPNRSIFFRCAVWLAFYSGKYREAEQMAACGLMGTPPEPIVNELREVLVAALSKLNALVLTSAPAAA